MNTNSKAVIIGRLSYFNGKLHEIHNGLKDIPKKPGSALSVVTGQAADVRRDLTLLIQDIDAQVKNEISVDAHFNRQTFEITLELLRKKVKDRFVGFPMAAALVETFILLLESEMNFGTSALALRSEVGAEDRRHPVHNEFYGVDGEPINKP